MGPEIGVSQNSFSNGRELQTEGGKVNVVPSSLSVGVLQEIGRRCSSRVGQIGSIQIITVTLFPALFWVYHIVFCNAG